MTKEVISCLNNFKIKIEEVKKQAEITLNVTTKRYRKMERTNYTEKKPSRKKSFYLQEALLPYRVY
jgi:hypothetical protein